METNNFLYKVLGNSQRFGRRNSFVTVTLRSCAEAMLGERGFYAIQTFSMTLYFPIL